MPVTVVKAVAGLLAVGELDQHAGWCGEITVPPRSAARTANYAGTSTSTTQVPNDAAGAARHHSERNGNSHGNGAVAATFGRPGGDR